MATRDGRQGRSAGRGGARRRSREAALSLEDLERLCQDFAGAPEEIGHYLRELEAGGQIGDAEVQAAFRHLASRQGADFARRAMGLRPSSRGGVVDADPGRAGRTEALLDDLAGSLGVARGELDVRVDEAAAARTSAEGARGLMEGGVVHLHPAHYAPERPEGRALLAHEVAHVAQRARTGSPRGSQATAEAEARSIGAAFGAGARVAPPKAALSLQAVAADRGSTNDGGDDMPTYSRAEQLGVEVKVRPCTAHASKKGHKNEVVDVVFFRVVEVNEAQQKADGRRTPGDAVVRVYSARYVSYFAHAMEVGRPDLREREKVWKTLQYQFRLARSRYVRLGLRGQPRPSAAQLGKAMGKFGELRAKVASYFEGGKDTEDWDQGGFPSQEKYEQTIYHATEGTSGAAADTSMVNVELDEESTRPLTAKEASGTLLSETLFEQLSAKLKPEGLGALRGFAARIGTFLQDHPQGNVTVTGHTCNQGDDDVNIELSIQRAWAVKDYLLEILREDWGITKPRILAMGVGSANAKPMSKLETRAVVKQAARKRALRSRKGRKSKRATKSPPKLTRKEREALEKLEPTQKAERKVVIETARGGHYRELARPEGTWKERAAARKKKKPKK